MPHVTIRSTMSLDGFLDDATTDRLILSNPEELALADEARARADAVLVGAGTIRADNPRLLVRSADAIGTRVEQTRPSQPMKLTMTRTGNIDPESLFFTTGENRKVVFCPERHGPAISARLGHRCEVVPIGGNDVPPENVLQWLDDHGVARLLIEGGTEVNSAFLTRGLADELHVAIAPFFVGQPDAARLVGAGDFVNDKDQRMQLKDIIKVGDMVVLQYSTGR